MIEHGTPEINKEFAKSNLIEDIKGYSEKISNVEFFKKLNDQELTLEEYEKFFSYKYSTVSYFVNFLKNGSTISQQSNLPNLQKAFQQNFEDESGIINGVYDSDWEHETWRKRMIDLLQVKKVENTNSEYNERIKSVTEQKNPFFMAGYLTATELFVAIEMRNLWNAMKRDLPSEMTEYSEENIPNNPLEYIKNHADHDGDHYHEILNAVISDMKTTEDLNNSKNGMKFAYEAREILYKNLNNKTFN
jgi:pyrroloquinoline quinone (PQQ) biosynthesis protein C